MTAPRRKSFVMTAPQRKSFLMTPSHQHYANHLSVHICSFAKETLCNTLQHAATYCNIPIRHAFHFSVDMKESWKRNFFVEESFTLPPKRHAATRCKTLQHAATYCNTPTQNFFVEESSTPPQKRHTCYTLRHNATNCNTLQPPTATHQSRVSLWRIHLLLRQRDTLQHTATHSNILQHTKAEFLCGGVICSSAKETHLRHTATHHNALQHTASHHCNKPIRSFLVEESSTPPQKRHTAIHCNTLQHAATHCNILQHNSSVFLCGGVIYSSAEESLLKNLGGTFSAIGWSNSSGNCRTPLQKSLILLYTWILYEINHLYMFRDPFMKYVWNESFLCVTWPIHMYDTTHFYVSYSCAHKWTAVFPSHSSANEFNVKKTELTESHTPPHINLLFWFFSHEFAFFPLTLFRTWVHCLKQRNLYVLATKRSPFPGEHKIILQKKFLFY